MQVFDLFLDVLFCIDVVINFCTAYTSRGVYITSMKAIAIHYCGTWSDCKESDRPPFDYCNPQVNNSIRII